MNKHQLLTRRSNQRDDGAACQTRYAEAVWGESKGTKGQPKIHSIKDGKKEEMRNNSGIQHKPLAGRCFRDNEQEERKQVVQTASLGGSYCALETFRCCVFSSLVKTRAKGHHLEACASCCSTRQQIHQPRGPKKERPRERVQSSR